jgi:Peptidase family M23
VIHTDAMTVVARSAAVTLLVAVLLALPAGAEGGVEDVAVAPLGGWWTVTADGIVTAHDGAPYYGDASLLPLVEPIVGMAPTPSGLGYWLVASDGGIFTYGDAGFFGSAGGIDLWQPIVAMAATDSGHGYWLLAADGGAFTYGDAAFLGSAAVEPSPARRYVDGGTWPSGYWVARADGEVALFDATGRAPGLDPECDPDPVVAVATDGTNWISINEPLPVPKPPVSAQASIIDSAAIAELLDFAEACQTARPVADVDLAAPVAGARRSSPFGERLHPIWGVVLLHSGQDLAVAAGTPVHAAASGVVVGVRRQVAYGWLVVIDHGGRVATVYAHLASVAVGVGDVLGQGDVIGRVGSTGFATGPHLHYELRYEGQPIDPAPYL